MPNPPEVPEKILEVALKWGQVVETHPKIVTEFCKATGYAAREILEYRLLAAGLSKSLGKWADYQKSWNAGYWQLG